MTEGGEAQAAIWSLDGTIRNGRALRRTWQEKGQRADRLAEKRTKVLFSIVGLILLGVVLYYVFRPKVSPDSDNVQHAGRVRHHISILIA